MPAHPKPTSPLTVAILALPESGTMAPYGLHEVLGEAGRGGNALRSLRPTLVAAEASSHDTGSGLRVTPQQGLEAIADILIICDIHLEPGLSPQGRWLEEIAWVRRHIEADALVCSACSGAVLLAEAGLLDGAEAASHWIMADLFRDRYPSVTFRPERILCDSGRAGRLITTGGASSWQDLALYLIGRFCGAEEAARIARLFLIGDRGDGQLPFAAMVRPRQHGNAAIADVQAWLADHYAAPNPVTAMVARSGMAERTFKRQFKAATGYAPVDYVQAMRIEEAKQMLETEPTAIEDIAFAVGYEDPTFFRKLFRRRVGVTPAQYRRRNRLRTLGA